MSSSSSSSFWYSSSSSSKDSSSSSSLQYSSSSSSLQYSSSSSSSYLDYHGGKLIPFTIESIKSAPAWDIAYYGGYAFVGTGSRGEILRSSDRYHWGVYYRTGDMHVSAVYTYGGYLYAGTSPQGKVYRFNLTNDQATLYGEFDSKIIGFVVYNSAVYFATDSGAIYRFDSVYDQWVLVYEAYDEVTEIDVINGKIYLTIRNANVVYFDGSNWNLLDMGPYNIASIRNITGEFSLESFTDLNRSTIIESQGRTQILDVYPQNRSIGLSCIEQDGTSIIMGSINKARVYSLIENDLELLFDTNSSNVYDLLNLDIGVNLAAIDNKLYLLSCGALPEVDDGVQVIDPSTIPVETINPNEGKTVVITFPNGGEQFQIGQDITIQWSSTRNQNDAVKLALYKNGSESQVIAAQTTNDGQFDWSIPLSLETGSKYQIYIEWLSAGQSSDENKDISDSTFTIDLVTTTTTTTTTAAKNPETPDRSSCRGIPILELPEDEYITKMSKDDTLNSIILLTSTGRILEAKESVINGYLTGNRTIWATARDGFGLSNVASTQYTYALHNRIIEVNEDKEIVKWKYVNKPAAVPVEKVTGVFTSPALYVQEDIGAWRTLMWTENKEENTEIIISLKAASTLEELKNKEWEYAYKSRTGEGTSITRDLSNIYLLGQYAQIKVEMVSQGEVSPSVANISLIYSTKQASYFFTTMFSLKNESDINKGLVIAEITDPINTEVQVGICNKDASDWNEYQIVPLEKFFDINNYENIKVGIKLTTYDESTIPEVSGFAMMFSGKKIQRLNT